jgi:hypothetical protein
MFNPCPVKILRSIFYYSTANHIKLASKELNMLAYPVFLAPDRARLLPDLKSARRENTRNLAFNYLEITLIKSQIHLQAAVRAKSGRAGWIQAARNDWQKAETPSPQWFRRILTGLSG